MSGRKRPNKASFVEQWFLSSEFDEKSVFKEPNSKCLKLQNTIKESENKEYGMLTRSRLNKKFTINPFDLNSDSDCDSSKSYLNFVCSTSSKTNASKLPISRQQSSDGDEGFETGSILSFVSQSTVYENIEDENSNLSYSDSLSSGISSYISKDGSNISNTDSNKSQFLTPPDNNTSDNKVLTSSNFKSRKKYVLPIVTDSSSENIFIPQISGSTLSDILTGKYNHSSNKFTVIDARFPYEYSGGHIHNAINLYTCQKLLQFLFPVPKNKSGKLEEDINQLNRSNLKQDNTVYIFYCEYSSYRAPKLAQCLRGLDRLAHRRNRHLCFPNIFVLYKGYNEFYKTYQSLCQPDGGYVHMNQTRYALRNQYCNTDEVMMMDDDDLMSPPYQSEFRKQQVMFEGEMRNSEKTLMDIINRLTDDTEILELFKFHPLLGGGGGGGGS